MKKKAHTWWLLHYQLHSTNTYPVISHWAHPVNWISVVLQQSSWHCPFKEGIYDNDVEKAHTNPSESGGGDGGLKGVQSVRVIDLSRGDTHGGSQQHTCMILMGGQAAGHPHLWEMDPAVRPLEPTDCRGQYSSRVETQAMGVGSCVKRYDDRQSGLTYHTPQKTLNHVSSSPPTL